MITSKDINEQINRDLNELGYVRAKPKLWTQFPAVTKIERPGLRICSECMQENKAYIMATMIQLVEDGKLDRLEVVKFETTGELSPVAKSVIWPMINIAPPELYELEQKFNISLKEMSSTLAQMVDVERARIIKQFEAALATAKEAAKSEAKIEVKAELKKAKAKRRRSANKRLRK